jgi:hypothetical protein
VNLPVAVVSVVGRVGLSCNNSSNEIVTRIDQTLSAELAFAQGNNNRPHLERIGLDLQRCGIFLFGLGVCRQLLGHTTPRFSSSCSEQNAEEEEADEGGRGERLSCAAFAKVQRPDLTLGSTIIRMQANDFCELRPTILWTSVDEGDDARKRLAVRRIHPRTTDCSQIWCLCYGRGNLIAIATNETWCKCRS